MGGGYGTWSAAHRLCVCVCVFLTCRTVPSGHWQPGVQFLLSAMVTSAHDTSPLTHCCHARPGGHARPAPSNHRRHGNKGSVTMHCSWGAAGRSPGATSTSRRANPRGQLYVPQG